MRFQNRLSPRVRGAAAIALILVACTLTLGWIWLRPSPGIPLRERLRTDLVLVEGRLCPTGQTVPFTGFMVERYDGGALKSRSGLAAGVLEGLSEGWYPNGQKQIEERFQAGLSHGLRTKWHENGQRQSQAHVLNGKLCGLFERWSDRGALEEQIQLNQGSPEGVSRAFYPSGYLKTEARLQAGRVVTQHSWKDGEQPATLLVQNAVTPER